MPIRQRRPSEPMTKLPATPPSLEELRIAAATTPSKSTTDSTFGVRSFYVAIIIAIAFITIAALTLR